jgi:hypothetical protein
MTIPRLVAVALLSAFGAGPVLASPCTDRINALEPRLNEAAESTASVSSGGQGVAAAREGQAMQAEKGVEPITPPTVPPFQDPAREAQATKRAADVGAGGDKVMQARAKLNEARALDQRGDGPACLEAITAAERHLDPR